MYKITFEALYTVKSGAGMLADIDERLIMIPIFYSV